MKAKTGEKVYGIVWGIRDGVPRVESAKVRRVTEKTVFLEGRHQVANFNTKIPMSEACFSAEIAVRYEVERLKNEYAELEGKAMKVQDRMASLLQMVEAAS